MNFRDSSQDSNSANYITKRVLLNGQFVTLYSINGQTWLSSPEDIPALMERLDNARVTLSSGDKDKEGANENGAKATADTSKDKKVVEGGGDDEASKRPLATKYKVKSPRPRPILRQDGMVITGIPVDPVSASSTALSFSSDPEYLEADAKMMSRSVSNNKKAPKKVVDSKVKGAKVEKVCEAAAPVKKVAPLKAKTEKLTEGVRGGKAVSAKNNTKNKREGGVGTQGIKAASKQNREAKRAIQAAAAATTGTSSRAKGAKISTSKKGKPERSKKVKANNKKSAKAVPQIKGKVKSGLKRSQGGEGRSRSARAMTAKGRGARSLR
jgi:hypothetical protein